MCDRFPDRQDLVLLPGAKDDCPLEPVMRRSNRSTSRRPTLGSRSHHPARRALPSELLLRLVSRVSGWLSGWWKRRMAGLKNWRAARQADHAQAQRMHFEALEPRLLMSADLNPVPLAEQYPAVADLQQVLQRIQALTVALNQVVDGDGTTASVSLTGPGSAQLLAQAGGFQLILTGTDATSKLSLVTSGGDGRITLSGISTDSAMGDLALAKADLRGNAQFVGAVGSLTLGRVQDSTISAPSANLAIVATDVSAATPGASKIIARA